MIGRAATRDLAGQSSTMRTVGAEPFRNHEDAVPIRHGREWVLARAFVTGNARQPVFADVAHQIGRARTLAFAPPPNAALASFW